MNIEKVLKNLEKRRFVAKYFDTAAEAADYMESQIQNTTVGVGGCKTADQMGLYERLSRNNSVYWHWKSTEPDVREKANSAKVYISSVNAMTEDGELLNIDGRGNRLAACVWGDKKLYYVVGINKICPDFASALERARSIAAVENCKRFDFKNPCKIDNKCHDCHTPSRICNALMVHWAPMTGMYTEVILIGEELGL